MGLEDEYRKHAGNLLNIASRQRDSADKSRLLSMAEAWLDLADRIAIKKGARDCRSSVGRNVLGPNRASTEMPRYHFVIHAPDYEYDDPDGMHFPNHEAAQDSMDIGSPGS
jgi:hypothetical protein